MKPETMKAAIFRDKGKVDLVNLPYPQCGDDDVIVKNLMSGVCGSDVNAYCNGGESYVRERKDLEFGHEVVSEVVEIGKNVKGIKVGDYLWPHLGHALRDRSRMAAIGAFSEYIRIVGFEEGYSAYPLDKSLPLESLAMVEPFIIGARAALNADPTPDMTAIVFGAGIIGMSCAIMLKHYGCEKVMIVDLSDSRLKTAEKFGLITVNSGKEDLKARAIEEFGEKQGIQGQVCGADAYIDCIGIQPILDSYASMAKQASTFIVVGVYQKPATINFQLLCYGQWNIKGCGMTPAKDLIPDIIKMMKSGKFDVQSLVTHKYPLAQINEALAMGGKPDEAQKVIIEFP